MNHKLKTLGLALVAALALTAVMASAAQANFTSSAASTTLSGGQTEATKFTAGTGIGGITCPTITLIGSMSGTSTSTMTLNPNISSTCTDSFGRVVHVVRNTLEYHLLSTAGKGNLTLTGELELTVTTSFGHCTIKTQGDQTFNGITYATSGNDLLISFHTNNITATVHGSPFACGTSQTHPTTGTLTGTVLMKGNGGAAKIVVH